MQCVNPTNYFPGKKEKNTSETRKCDYEDVSISVSSRSIFQTCIILALIFIGSLLMLLYIYVMFPTLESHELQYIKLPQCIDDVKYLGQILDRYKEQYYIELLLAIVITYIFLQAFAIPGSVFLSILTGFLFSFPIAIIIVCFCSATGALFCYLLSYFLGRHLVYKYFPNRVTMWAKTVQEHRHNLFNYILFLRITPFIPNWFINLASPIINVPILPFWLGTFIGVAPPSFFAIQAGQTLHMLSDSNEMWPWVSISLLIVFSLLSLLPVLLKEQLWKKTV